MLWTLSGRAIRQTDSRESAMMRNLVLHRREALLESQASDAFVQKAGVFAACSK